MLIRTNILNPVFNNRAVLRKNCLIRIKKKKIETITDWEGDSKEYYDLSDYVCLPGFIDTHSHLAQLYATGKYETDLVSWLRKHIFKEESKSFRPGFAIKLASDFYSRCLEYGITTNLIYTSNSRLLTESACYFAKLKGVKSYIGHVLMDRSLSNNKLDKSKIIKDIFNLLDFFSAHYHFNRFVITPRFALSCTPELMKMVAKIAHHYNLIIQTHLSENINEVKAVGRLYPRSNSYTQVYEDLGLLSEKTVVAHCIHLKKEELDILKKYNVKISHCPDSNFFLHSGRFNYKLANQTGLQISLGSDVGAGTSLSMLNTMKMACYSQQSKTFNPHTAFFCATLGGAATLGIENETGSIRAGKKADLIFFKFNNIHQKNATSILNELVFLRNHMFTDFTMSEGVFVYAGQDLNLLLSHSS